MASSPLPSVACSASGCKNAAGFLEVLESASNSIPATSEILYTCSICGHECAIWVAEGKIRVSEKSLVTELPALHVYVDPTYGVDCIFQGKLYHMPRRLAPTSAHLPE